MSAGMIFDRNLDLYAKALNTPRAQFDALVTERNLEFTMGRLPFPKDDHRQPFKSAISRGCVGCGHTVYFETEDQASRFIASSGWVDTRLVCACGLCKSQLIGKSAA